MFIIIIVTTIWNHRDWLTRTMRYFDGYLITTCVLDLVIAIVRPVHTTCAERILAQCSPRIPVHPLYLCAKLLEAPVH